MKKSTKKIMMFMVCLVALCFCKSVEANAQAMISSGYYHTAMIKNDGSLWMSGRNQSGQLGDGTTTNTSKWKKVMTGVRYVSAGGWHTAIIKNDDSLWMCGQAQAGRLGNEEEGTVSQATPVKIMTNVASVSAGTWHTAILKNDGSLWMCGSNGYGKLGDGTTTSKATPVKIMTDVKKVYCGSENTAIIKKDNSLWVCGLNNYGQIGDGTTTNRYTSVKVMTNVKDVGVSGYFIGALKNDGTVWTWGNNTAGKLGDGTTTNRTKPVKVASDVASLSIGYSHSAIIKKDGSLWTWGYNKYGEIGNNTTTDCYAPQKIMTGVSSVSLRGWHTVVMKKNGSLQAWGNNEYGQLGDGTTTNRLVPTKEVFYFVKAQQISASSRTVSNKTKSFSLNAKTNGNGKLSYSSSNKGVVTVNSNGQVRVVNCGIAEITIKASATTGYFAATKKITIQVIPSKPSLRTVKSPAKKIITAKWKKDKTITGYQFYMSTNKSFKTGTLAREYKSNKTQFKIFGWKSKKTYYLKMRSYKKVGGKKIYSDWSSVKKVKVK